jgi:uncharacterized protein (TIGR00369 family)
MSGHHPPPTRRNAGEQARLDAALIHLFEQRIVFNSVLGLKIVSVTPGDVRATLAMRPDLIGHYAYGRLHGGAIAATLDTLGGLALMVDIGERFAADDTAQILHRFLRMGTIDLRVDYLRPGLGEVFYASAETTRLGGRVGNTRMEMRNAAGELLATGVAAYMVS